MRAALADYHPADWFSTAQTGQARSSKDIQSFLIPPALASGSLEIRLAMSQRGSHVLDAAAQNTTNGNMQAAGFRCVERGCDAAGVPPHAVEVQLRYVPRPHNPDTVRYFCRAHVLPFGR